MSNNKTLTYITLIIVFTISFYAIYTDLTTIKKKVTNIEVVSKELNHILILKNMIREIQKERGLTSIYHTSNNKEILHSLQTQKEKVSQLIKKNTNQIKFKNLQAQIQDLRQNVIDDVSRKDEVFEKYTEIIFSMILESKKLLFYTNNQEIKNHFFLFQKTNYVQEYLGQLRATIGSILAKKEISDEEYIEVIKLSSLAENYIRQTQEDLQFEKIQLQPPIADNCFKQIHNIINTIKIKKLSKVEESPLEWFQVATCSIDLVESKMIIFLQLVKKEIQEKDRELQSQLLTHMIFWFVTLLISILLIMLLFRTNKEVLQKRKLLNDYKKAIDDSTIVSKTDKYGIITYANKAFCKISGYSEEELIGQSHNIVRDPSVDKEIFRTLWKTIKSGKTWYGQVVNRAKNNSQYWVNATISPIFDDSNNLVEYIAIRHDITELMELQKEINNTQYELIYRMSESVESRSKESGNHIKRVAHYSKLLSQLYGFEEQEAEIIFISSMMHDIGKIAIPDSILLKPARLTDEEYELMKTHSFLGYKILSGSNLPILKIATQIAYEHHERYDGKGYPNKLQKDEISIHAQIVAITDVFDALISDRVYKKAWQLDKIIKLFQEESGKQFNPKLTQLFLENIDKFIEIKIKFKD